VDLIRGSSFVLGVNIIGGVSQEWLDAPNHNQDFLRLKISGLNQFSPAFNIQFILEMITDELIMPKLYWCPEGKIIILILSNSLAIRNNINKFSKYQNNFNKIIKLYRKYVFGGCFK
jgi:hypothetical protein